MQCNVDREKVLDLNRRFHDEVEAHSYDQRMGVDHRPAAVRETLAELERVLGAPPLPAGGTVLDVGAGTGNLAVKLALDGRFDRVIAMDISAGMLTKAREAAQARGVEVDTLVSDMERLPFADGSVDCVVGCAVLHHLPDPVGFMAEVARVLKPGAPAVFIGEPSSVGERLTHVAKAPLLFAVGVARKFGVLARPLWEHEAIDVHTFTPSDVTEMTAPFQNTRFTPEGFAGPIVDQGLLSAMLLIARGARPVQQATDAARKALRKADRWIAPAVPPAWRASVKFAAFR